MTRPITFGIFCPPVTQVQQNPTMALHRQLDLVTSLDQLGFDEFWVGEHHNGGGELISSPEIFIAAAAERTKNIKLATGVTTLPYHHPFVAADRMVMLDHLTRGRVIFGTGPGSLAADAYHMGYDYQENRRKYAEALDAVIQLLGSDEPVNIETDWFTLRDALLPIKPYQYPRMEISTVATVSPTGPKLAGKHGISLLSISASSPMGYDALHQTWDIVETEAARAGQTATREGWRLVSFYHLADTEAQAREDVKYGLEYLLEYLSKTTGVAQVTDPSNINLTIDELNESGLMVIGTPDRMVEHLRGFEKQTGGFGGFLGFAHEMADARATLHSHELMMRDVIPVIQGTTTPTINAWDRMKGTDWANQVAQAQERAVKEYEAEKG